MLEKNIVVGSFQCNCRILVCPVTGDAVLIDPGDESKKLITEIQAIRLPSGAPIQVKYLFHTHGHLDHVGATRDVHMALAEKPKIALHKGDEPLYLNLKMQGRLFGIQYESPLPVQHYFQDEEQFKVGHLKFSIIHTPGHSPGSLCIRLHEDSSLGVAEALFSGDTLFQGSVGRTDLWGGDQDLMFKSIHQRILVLDEDTRVCPGHGDDTLIGVEKLKNPFLGS
jgi:hydroxyacylglutathione hydrolase